MKDRIILHIDMDYFFAQIEERENPRFRGMPIIVGADPKKGKGRGVVSSASYSARKFGIKSAMPISKAYQLCPNAIFLPVAMELYERVSQKIMEIIKRYSPKWEITSLDETYLDLSFLIPKTKLKEIKLCSQFQQSQKLATEMGLEEGYQRAENLAQKLKNEIFKKEKLTSTVGIGPNKLIAKMASQKAKPSQILQSKTWAGKPDGLLVIKPNQIEKFLEPLNIEDLLGIGPKTAEKLRNLKNTVSPTDQSVGLKIVNTINTIEDLKRLNQKTLVKLFGKWGKAIWERARGIDKTPVTSEEIIKSIGKEHTFEKDTRDPEIIFCTFERIIKEVYEELSDNNFNFRTITVICRFSGFETHTKSKTLEKPTQDLEILKKASKKLLLKFLLENKKPVRLIGLRLMVN